MPCNSDYMNATGLEVDVSQMILLKKELKTGKHPNTESDAWRGYHKDAYGQTNLREKADELAAHLCSELRKRTPAQIKDMSLEMQLWWREHQKADKKRGEA